MENLHTPRVNFIKVLCAQFLKKILAPKLQDQTLPEKGCSIRFRKKNALVKC